MRSAPVQGARFAASPRFASDQGASFAVVPRFAPAQSAVFAAAPRFAPAQGAVFAAGPHPASDLRLASDLSLVRDLSLAPPDLSLASPDLSVVPEVRLVPDPADHAPAGPGPRPSSQPATQALSFSVLAALTEDDKARPAFAPSNSGVAFPTRARALCLVGGHMLAALGIAILSLGSTPIGHYVSHVGNTSVGSLAVLSVFAGLVFAVAVAARIQHDIMGGGWDGGFAPRYISYISPQVALYVISPSGISAAARRLNIPSGRVILVEYGVVAAAVLLVLYRYVGR